MTILIVDDDAFNREGVRLFLEEVGYAVQEAGDTESAWQQVQQTLPAAVVLDIVLPAQADAPLEFHESAGVAFAQRLKRDYPALGIVLFSAHEDRGSGVLDMICQGVRGVAYRLKGCSPTSLLETIDAVQAGQVIIDAEVTSIHRLSQRLLGHLSTEERQWVSHTVAYLPTLSPREMEVAQRVAASHSNQRIATDLSLSPKTVENCLSRVYEKTNLNEVDSKSLRRVLILAKACLIKQFEDIEA